MHLAIKTSDRLQNTRAIRLLLYQGASVEIRDSSGNSAIEIANSLEDSKVKAEILRLLTHKPGIVEQLGYKSSLKKVKKSWKFPSIYVLFHVAVYVIAFIFVMPLWHIYMVYAAGGILALNFFSWIISMCHSPGFIKPHPNVEFLVSTILFHSVTDISLCSSNSCN